MPKHTSLAAETDDALPGRTGKVLVTGANGFIGPHLVQSLLDAGHSVRCLVRSSSNRSRLTPFEVELVEGDVGDPESLRRAVAGTEFVFHLASMNKAIDEQKREQVNVVGTGNVAAACAGLQSPPVLVVVSSLAAGGPSPPDCPRREADPPAPVSRYGKSKLGGEQAAARWAAEVPISIVRPPIVFGEGDTDFISMMRPIARFGLHITPGTARNRFSLIHAADAAHGFLLVAQRGDRLPTPEKQQSEPGTGIFFVANEEMPSYADLGWHIAAALDRKRIRVIRGPLWLAWLAGTYGEIEARIRGRAGIINLDKAREASAGSWTCNTERIRQLGFRPVEELPTRLRQTARWYLEQKWL